MAKPTAIGEKHLPAGSPERIWKVVRLSECQKIRNGQGYWDRIETYIQDHSEATFSHSLCPDCARELYPDIFPEENEPPRRK